MKQPETFECCYKGFLLVNECTGKVIEDKLISFDWNYRQEQFENSAAGRAAPTQQQAMAKKYANTNKGDHFNVQCCSMS